jgi:hypothetical protein
LFGRPLVRSSERARGIHAGPIVNSAAAEAMTSILISINMAYKVPGAGLRITGLPASFAIRRPEAAAIRPAHVVAWRDLGNVGQREHPASDVSMPRAPHCRGQCVARGEPGRAVEEEAEVGVARLHHFSRFRPSPPQEDPAAAGTPA